uniref:Serpin n=1 Tax=Sphenophorus levis TaxID=572107 RepID=B6ZAZ6_9CUCU|nr:serpin [Sphenophorus levis]
MKFVLVLATLVAYVSTETALDEFTAGNHLFTSRLYTEVLKENQNKNFLFSPLSAEIILSLTQAGAKGPTAEEFTTALNFPSTQEKTQDAIKQFLPRLRSNTDDLQLATANRLFLGKDFKVLDSFQQLASSVYEASAVNVNFGNNVEAAKTINSWVEDQTNKKIKDLISPDAVGALTRLVLVNALYFKGKWASNFEEYATRKQKFYVTKENTKEVDMMHQTGYFRYYECTKHNVKFLELPYKGDNVTMTIVLPNEIEGLAAVEDDISTYLKTPPYKHENVEVSLPKWLVETTIQLKPILQKLGLLKAFGNADFSNLSKESLYIDSVIQKAFINVTESGTEAAAATAVSVNRISSFQPKLDAKIFNADHQFFYVIKHSDVVLFAGKIHAI